MRIITGYAKGKKLKAPEGLTTRPTADRIKESVFNIISPNIFDSNVLDLFAGTGGLGLECVSRGCRNCTFVEKDKKAFKILDQNIKSLRCDDKVKYYNMDSFLFLKKYSNLNNTYDIVFLDPPYFGNLIEKSINEIYNLNLLSENGIIISEYDTKEKMPEYIASINRYRDVNYGRTTVSFWNFKED